MTDYPVVFYKGPSCDNSDLVLANFAHKEPIHLVIDLDEWVFLCFVRTPDLSGFGLMSNYNQSHSRAFILAKNRDLGNIRLMMIEVDPWERLETRNLHL